MMQEEEYEEEIFDRMDNESFKVANAFTRSAVYEQIKQDIAFLKEKVTKLELALKNNNGSYHHNVRN